MEDTLRVKAVMYDNNRLQVLILVLMEDTLRAVKHIQKEAEDRVLILVLMEDTLRVPFPRILPSVISLNPCFNGRYSQS